jgi:ATP-dependent RNA helicase DDX10/DBP4
MEMEGEGGGITIGDPSVDALANFRADAEFSEDESEEPAEKKPKKWFQSDSEDEEKDSKRRKKGKGDPRAHVEEPQTLEDMEALAAGLLG